jgi:hypothetical protein
LSFKEPNSISIGIGWGVIGQQGNYDNKNEHVRKQGGPHISWLTWPATAALWGRVLLPIRPDHDRFVLAHKAVKLYSNIIRSLLSPLQSTFHNPSVVNTRYSMHLIRIPNPPLL